MTLRGPWWSAEFEDDTAILFESGKGLGLEACLCVGVLPAITFSILGFIIHVKRILTLNRSAFAAFDISFNF